MHSLGVVDQIDGRVELKIPCQKPKFPNYKKCTIIIIKSGFFFRVPEFPVITLYQKDSLTYKRNKSKAIHNFLQPSKFSAKNQKISAYLV